MITGFLLFFRAGEKPARKLVFGEHGGTPPLGRLFRMYGLHKDAFIGVKKEMQRQNGKKFRHRRLLRQRMPGQSFQPLRIGIPEDRDSGSNVALHILPGGRVMLRHLRIQPLCHQT